MTVYVDELVTHTIPTTIPRCFRAGSCHLMADTPEELQAFARRLGLRRGWFQDHPLHPHYDLTPPRRAQALARGAVFMPAREQARRRMRKQEESDRP